VADLKRTALIAQVLPDIRAIDKVFDYVVPESMAPEVRVGTMVRIRLAGRRVGGWVVGLSDTSAAGERKLEPIAKVTGWGPPADLIDLAGWAAWRWAGRRSTFLATASPPGAVRGLPPGRPSPAPQPGGLSVVRMPPATDPYDLVAETAGRGPTLVLAPSADQAVRLAVRLRGDGQAVALASRDWARAAAGGVTVVGSRAAAWAPLPDLSAVVALDVHDEAYTEERTPSWNGWRVAAERARRAGVPCLLTSPCPPIELQDVETVALSRTEERAGWPVVDVVDRRRDDPRTGLYSERLVQRLRSGGRTVCVLNRKGRAKLLACAACGALARCERCGAAVEQTEEGLRCRQCLLVRPVLCAACGSQKLKTLRAGVTRVREELEALAGVPVAEITGDTKEPVPEAPVVVGTEAVLHRVPAPVDTVAFLDFDQELLAPRFRATEQALALIVRAARLVGGRSGGGRVLIQTRLPKHEVVEAALHADPARIWPVERERRAALRFPPYAALAVVSGDAAPAFVAALPGTVDALGPDDGRWLVRAPSTKPLCDALAATPRPSGGRLRIEVDPVRL